MGREAPLSADVLEPMLTRHVKAERPLVRHTTMIDERFESHDVAILPSVPAVQEVRVHEDGDAWRHSGTFSVIFRVVPCWIAIL